MHFLSIAIFCGVAILLLAGCSSNSEMTKTGLTEVDREYVDAVNNEARVGGASRVDVYWVNPPTKRNKNSDSEPPL